MATLSYCAELTRTYYRNRYLCALFAPEQVREAWFALFAFAYEIETIAYKVGEEMVGFVRYAWWRETLTAVFKDTPPRGHPYAEALAKVVATYQLPQASFEAIIDAHERALADKQPLDEAFFNATALPLMQLCAKVAGIDANAALAIAFSSMETALFPHTTQEHKTHFITLARAKLTEAKPVRNIFVPFAHLTEFHIKKLERNRPISPSDKALWLPLYLWRKRGITY